MGAAKRVPYTDARGERRWVEVEAGLARDLDSYDRWARKREALYRANHVSATDAAAARGKAPGARRHATARLIGYLNYELEPAAVAAGHARRDGAAWEGPRYGFTWLLGEGATWEGPQARVTVREVVGPPGAKRVETTEYGIEAVGPETCRRCAGLPELPPYAVCLDCCRSGRDREIDGGGRG